MPECKENEKCDIFVNLRHLSISYNEIDNVSIFVVTKCYVSIIIIFFFSVEVDKRIKQIKKSQIVRLFG